MKKLVLILLLLLIPCGVFANAYVSQQDGLWSRSSDNADSPWFDGGAQSVWASFPQATDTFDIVPGHTVTIDGDITVGDTALNDTTYDNVIQGNLVWPANPGTDWTFKTSSSILISGVGKFYIGCTPGTPATRLNCNNTAIVEFQTGFGIKYDIRIAGASAQLIVRGCEGYPAYNGAVSLGIETRARITACAPDCLAGVNRTLTLDTDVNWQGVTNPATVSGNPEVAIGGGGSLVFPGFLAANFTAELAEIDLYPAANQVRVATLAKDHVIGDMVANPTRNILFRSSNVTNHGSIYSTTPSGQTEKPFMVSWVRLDEMGDASYYNTAGLGIDLNAATSNWGTIEYTWATNCSDGLDVTCFYILEGDFDSFDWNGAHDPHTSGRGMNMLSTAAGKTVTGFTAIDIGGVGIPTGTGWQSGTSARNVIMDQLWVSNASQCYTGSAQAITNSVFHHCYGSAVNITTGYTWGRHKRFLLENNEIRNIRINGAQLAAMQLMVIGNDFDNIDDNCVYASAGTAPAIDFYSEGNTFDHCNMDGTVTSEGALCISSPTGTVYSQNDDFGSTMLNEKANILFFPNRGNTNTTYMRATFNNPILNGPANPTWAYPLIPRYYNSDWTYRYAFGPSSFVTIHNEDQVADTHWGFGPGGMIVEHVTGAGPTGGWVDNTVNLKVIPFAADRYTRVRVGTVRVDSGDVLQVNLQIQKNQAITTGRRPRLVLKGCGFDPVVDYDEMADVNNTWDTVTVSGTAAFDGGVQLYLEVLNDLDPAPAAIYIGIQPVDPPVIIVYVDGRVWTKS